MGTAGSQNSGGSQHQCWEIGAEMGTAGNQNSDGSQHQCWEPNGKRLGPYGNQMGTETGVENSVVPSTTAGNQMGTKWEPYGNF